MKVEMEKPQQYLGGKEMIVKIPAPKKNTNINHECHIFICGNQVCLQVICPLLGI
jgi:hypothetical protein